MIDRIQEVVEDWLMELESTEPLPFAFQNVEFVPPADGSGFVDVSFVWSDVNRLSLGSAREYRCQLMLVLALPAGQGSAPTLRAVQRLKDHFPVDFKLPLPDGGHVRVTEEASARSGYRDDLYWRIPLMVPLQALVA